MRWSGARAPPGCWAAGSRRVRTAPSDVPGWLGPEEWLLIEDADEPGDRSHWLISLPVDTPLADLVRHAKGRWRVEQGYRDLKQEVGLGHFEGRSWRGLNHHVTLCLAAYGFLVRERSLFPLGTLAPNSPETSTPVRPARHSPWSIASLRRRIAGHLFRSLPRCPYCGIGQSHPSQIQINSPQLE